MEVDEQQPEVIVVGAGVLGNALAYALAADGRRVALFERDWSEPDRIVGELLQPGGVKALQLLGLGHCIEDIDGIDCHGYAIFRDDGDVCHIAYPKNKSPNMGKSFHHGKFISKLRQASKSHPRVTPIEATVNSLIHDPNNPDRVIGVTYTQKVSSSSSLASDSAVDLSSSSSSAAIVASAPCIKEMRAPLTIIADGCFSKFRKQVISKEVHVKSNFVGLVLEDCDLPVPNHGHVVLAKPSPILLYQIGTRDTRILIDIPGKLPNQSNGEMKTYLMDFVGPQLPERVRKSYYNAVESQRPRSMPNSWLPPSTNRKQGMILIGDAMNMRHPLTGGGMTVALWDVVHLQSLLHPKRIPDLSDSNLVLAQMTRLHWIRKPLSSVVNILAQALYALFAAGDDRLMWELQNACFGYLKLGGRCSSTPAGLLAGLIPSPMTLVGHFFAVAFYGVFKMITREPIYMLPIVLFNCFRVLLLACVVIGPVLMSEMKS